MNLLLHEGHALSGERKAKDHVMRLICTPKIDVNELCHADLVRIPVPLAVTMAMELGEPVERIAGSTRYHGALVTNFGCGFDASLPFALVIDTRGASLRAHWSHLPLILENMIAGVPILTVERIAA